MSISVILATYNGERYLPEQLESIHAQTLAPGEVIITDDGSTDDTLAIAAQFRETVRGSIRVSIVNHRSTRDPSDNFRFGVRHCSGEWVAFCDQDDRWLPEKLAVMHQYAERHRLGMVSCGYRMIDAAGRPLPEEATVESKEFITRIRNPNTEYTLGCCQLLSREVAMLVAENPPNDGNGRRESHDFASLMIARHKGGVLLMPDVLLEYRRHGGNVSELKQGDAHTHAMWNQTGADNFLHAARTARARAAWWDGLPKEPATIQAVQDWSRRAVALERRARAYRGDRSARLATVLRNVFIGTYGVAATGRLPFRSCGADLLRLMR